MVSQLLFSLPILASLLSVSAIPVEQRSIPGEGVGSSTEKCAQNTFGTICTPSGNPKRPIGDHINIDLIATGLPFSKGVSVALKSKKTGKRTELSWSQRDSDGISDGTFDYKIITSHVPGIYYGDLGHGFHGEGQLPCSALADSPAGQEDFDWLMTHYYGDDCSYSNPSACQALITDVPPLPFTGYNSTITIKDNAEICGRS